MKEILSTVVRLVLVGALVITGSLLLATQSVSAQTLFPAYTSGVQVANLSSTNAAAVTLIAYNPDGTVNGTPLTDNINANSSKTYFPISNVTAGFSGSIVISANQNVAAISNILSANFTAGASYVGRSAGSTTVLLPLLNKNNAGFTTWYSIQNAGNADATVNIAYSDGTSSGPHTIKPGAAKIVYQSQETHSAPVFAGTVTSTQPVVAAVIQESTKIIFAYTGFAAGSTNPVFPLINANNVGYVTGLQIQNAGGTATDVTVSYTPSQAGTACTETRSIAPGASATFALAAFANGNSSTCTPGAKFIGSARVTTNSTNQPLVGIGNQLGAGNGEAYNAFAVSDAGSSVVMPLIMDRNSGFFTGFSVQNIGGSATAVNCTFQNTSYTVGATLQPGQALADIQQGKIAPSYVGSGTCTGAAGSQLVAVVNELSTATGVDLFLVYEGVKP